MTKAQDYITDNTDYLNADATAIIEALSDDQFDALVAAGEYWGGSEPGIDNKLVKTNETLADFDASRAGSWSARGGRDELSIAFPAVSYEGAQVVKGQPRRTFVVVDLGDFRVVVE